MTQQMQSTTSSLARVLSLWHCVCWTLVLGLCGSGSCAHAMNALRLDDGVGNVALADKFEAFVDHGAQLSLADVQRPANADRFAPMPNGRSDALPNEAVWLRIALHNTATEPKTWWLDTGILECRTIELYAADEAGTYQRQSASPMLPFSARALPLKTFAFPLKLQSAKVSVVYIRVIVAWGRVLQFEPKIWKPSVLENNSRTERNRWLAYVGAASALILFNLLLATALRDRHYALYALASLALLWCVSSWMGGYGSAFEMLWPDWPAFERFGYDSSGVAAIVTGAIFVSSLLSLPTQTPRIHTTLLATTGLYLFCWVVLHTVGFQSSFEPGPVSVTVAMIVSPFYNLAAALTILFIGIAIVRLAWQGSRPARFLALAFAPVVIAGLAANLMSSLNILLPSDVMMWATLFEMLMMAFALADRFHQDRQEKLRAQSALVAGLQASEREMEGKVVMRTQELSEALTLQQIAVAQNLDLVTQLTAQKNVAEAAVLAKSRFLAAASHDLRQPTHALALFIATLQSMGQREEVKGVDVSHIAGRLQTALSGLGRLLNGLLDVSRLDAGAVEVRKQAVSLRKEFTSLYNAFSGPAHAKGLTLRVRLPADLSVDTDPVLLHQILSNLVANAVRYTEHGSILIGCRWRARGVEIQVCDTGIGIASDERGKIFEEFYQVSNAARNHGLGLGLGLGLAIVQRSAHLLGAPLEIVSALGKGSMFSFTLPRVVAGCAVREGNVVQAISGGQHSATVLVIDDDAQVRDAVKILLSNWGCTVVAAGTVEQAIESAAAMEATKTADGNAQKIDLILSDYRLAGKANGADAIRAVCARIGRQIPAVIVTGDTSPERIIEARASGFRLLYKPLDPQVLNALLREYEASRRLALE